MPSPDPFAATMPAPAPAHDLTDAEFAELDELLAATPEPLEPLDAVMLDGYLCGVLVQPVLLAPEVWLAHVFDFEGAPLPGDVDAAWRQRITALIMRRHAALNRALAEDGWFEPLVLEADDEADDAQAEGDQADGPAAFPGSDHDDANPAAAPAAPTDAGRSAASDAADADPADGLGPISQALMPWVGGFEHAASCFPDLIELPDDDVATALARLYRHLPASTDEEREIVATLDREHPLATLDDAMAELVGSVADLYDLTSEQRYKVETVKRDAPKVGRNDPCPCGSGKKFKHCHGG